MTSLKQIKFIGASNYLLTNEKVTMKTKVTKAKPFVANQGSVQVLHKQVLLKQRPTISKISAQSDTNDARKQAWKGKGNIVMVGKKSNKNPLRK